MSSVIEPLPADYAAVLGDLKQQVRSARLTAQRRVNTELVGLYWSIGHTILQRQEDQDWGSAVVARLAEDLRAEFPEMKGFSRSNLFYMRAFAVAWPDKSQVVQQPAGLTGKAAEREREQALMDRIVETLRELGVGFAFVGRQVHLEGDDFFIDLLFFHTEQLRYVVVELKTGKFEPAFTGQLSFYIAVVDDKLRRDFHRPTVGILICGSRNEHTVRYALGKADSPMAVSTYTYESLPPAEQQVLPTAEQITSALDWPVDVDATGA